MAPWLTRTRKRPCPPSRTPGCRAPTRRPDVPPATRSDSVSAAYCERTCKSCRRWDSTGVVFSHTAPREPADTNTDRGASQEHWNRHHGTGRDGGAASRGSRVSGSRRAFLIVLQDLIRTLG